MVLLGPASTSRAIAAISASFTFHSNISISISRKRVCSRLMVYVGERRRIIIDTNTSMALSFHGGYVDVAHFGPV